MFEDKIYTEKQKNQCGTLSSLYDYDRQSTHDCKQYDKDPVIRADINIYYRTRSLPYTLKKTLIIKILIHTSPSPYKVSWCTDTQQTACKRADSGTKQNSRNRFKLYGSLLYEFQYDHCPQACDRKHRHLFLGISCHKK